MQRSQGKVKNSSASPPTLIPQASMNLESLRPGCSWGFPNRLKVYPQLHGDVGQDKRQSVLAQEAFAPVLRGHSQPGDWAKPSLGDEKSVRAMPTSVVQATRMGCWYWQAGPRPSPITALIPWIQVREQWPQGLLGSGVSSEATSPPQTWNWEWLPPSLLAAPAHLASLPSDSGG